MPRRVRPTLLKIFFLLLVTAASQRAESTERSVRYELRFPNAAHHEAQIRATFSGIPKGVLEIRMSRSSPGRYALHEFAKNVYNLRAMDAAGRPLTIIRHDPYGWNVAEPLGTVVVEYTLFGDHLDGTYAAIDPSHAHLNLPATLVWARGFEGVPASLRFDIPNDSHWRVATQLAQQNDGTWTAPNLEQLMDSPVELSAHAEPRWTIGDSAFRLSLHHRGSDAQAAVFAEMCKAVVLEEEGVFGSFPKYDTGSYTFLIDYLPWAVPDGMEHRDSAVISGASDLRLAAAREIGTVSHEFFHSWNVRRIRPRSLEPFDFERANMAGELWFAEGFTNYYGILVLKRAGLSSLEHFVSEMGAGVNRVLTAPGRTVHNAIEMSRLAPFVDAAKSIDANNFPNTFISYYTYGQALAFGIDLTIRSRFPGKSLDDWMRVMWREHSDIDRPYTLDDLEKTLGEATGDPQFAAEIFRRHIYGKESMEYAPLLGAAGLLLRKSTPERAWLGAETFNNTGDGVEIANGTLRDSPLYNAGLDAGDRIMRADKKALKSSADLEQRVAKREPGEHLQLGVRLRSGEEKDVEVVLGQDPTFEIVTNEQAGKPVTDEMNQFRRAWLGSKALYPLPAIPAMP